MSIFQILTSSIGRKILMAISGLLLSFFMAFHLVGNLFLFVGEEAFNSYVDKLKYLGFLIRIAEFFLLTFVLSHAYSGLLLWWKNRQAKKNTSSYSKENTSSSARHAALTGSVIFIFLVTHWATFWYKFNFGPKDQSYYDVVIGGQVGFANPFLAQTPFMCFVSFP